jgi:hypothetical protein
MANQSFDNFPQLWRLSVAGNSIFVLWAVPFL